MRKRQKTLGGYFFAAPCTTTTIIIISDTVHRREVLTRLFLPDTRVPAAAAAGRVRLIFDENEKVSAASGPIFGRSQVKRGLHTMHFHSEPESA